MDLTEEEQFEEFRTKLQSVTKNSKFFKEHPPRSLPCFNSSELKIGQILGVGGFCDVSEITAIELELEEDANDSINHNNNKTNDDDDDENQENSMIKVNNNDKYNEENSEGVYNEEYTLKSSSIADGSEDEDEEYQGYEGNDFDGHDQFKHIKDVKLYMSQTFVRQGDQRYAIKVMRKDLTEKERRYGVMDLAVEAKFLASIIHPNIIKMRGTAAGDPISNDFFLVLDKLYGTLDQRIKVWSTIPNINPGFCGCCGVDKTETTKLLLDRITVAYDLSSAFLYLHQQGLIYRDIKLENIGFDVRGDAKVFDFGLCKELKAKDKTKDGLYKLTKQTGSFRYMAPENAKGQHYDQRVDVYSFGVLLYEILSLKIAFETFDVPDFKKVFNQGYRPPLPASIPVYMRTLIKESWSGDMNERPNFSRIANLLRGEMRDLSDASEVMNRTKHMLNRSRTSGHIHLKNLNGVGYSEKPPKTEFMTRASSSEIK